MQAERAALVPLDQRFGPVHEEIARLAYYYWQARGCPIGSPEEDWYRAEKELRQEIAAAAG